MILYIEKGANLHKAISNAGYTIYKLDGSWVSSDDTAVQAIIDSYDPLPEAQAEAIDRVNVAAGEARAKYATDIPFQTEAYEAKLTDAKAFRDAGYDESTLANYAYTHGRATRQGITGQVAADLIIAIAAQWDMLMFGIEDARDAANEAINAETDWQQCSAIADSVIAQIEAI